MMYPDREEQPPPSIELADLGHSHIHVDFTHPVESPKTPKSTTTRCLFLYPLILYLCLITISFTLIFSFDTFGTQQGIDNVVSVFHLLQCQLLFYVGILITCAEVTMRASANNSEGVLPYTSKHGMTLLLVLTSVLVIQIPSITERAAPPVVLNSYRGGCSDDLSWSTVKDVCPLLAKDAPLFMKTTSVGTIGVRDSFNTIDRLMEAVPVVKLAHEYYKTNPNKLELFIAGAQAQANALHFLNDNCLYSVIDWFCSRLLTPCRITDCSPLNATLCSTAQVTTFLYCAKARCKADPLSCNPDDIDADLMYNMIRALNSWIFENSKYDGYNLQELVASSEYILLQQSWALLVHDLQKYSQLLADYNDVDCDIDQEQASSTSITATTCDPNVTSVTIPSHEVELDGSYVLIAILGIVTVIILFSSCNGITVEAPHKVAVINGMLGVITAMMIFVGGLNIERYAFSMKHSVDPRPDLMVWSAAYYLLSLLAFHHSLFMFLPTERLFRFSIASSMKWMWKHKYARRYLRCKKPKDPNAPPKKKKPKKMKLLVKRCCAHVLWWDKNVVKPTGKHFIVFMWLKEITQTVQQLIGVANSSDETEAYNAVSTVMLVSCSMIVLPTAYQISLHHSGPTLAVAINIFLDSVIDKVYILFSVFVRRTETAVGGRNVVEALLRHSLTLLPALQFVRSGNKFYELHKSYQLHSAAQLTLVTMQEQKAQIAHRRTKSSQSSRRTSLTMEMKSNRHVAINGLSIVGVLTGFSLGLFSIIRFVTIQSHCRKMLGVSFAECAHPKHYFKTGYFLGTPGCAVEEYREFACANKLRKEEYLLNNASIYAKMVRLKKIDVSGNTHLVALPSSWIAVPTNLLVLASQNKNLKNVPFTLCNATASNITLDASNTHFSKNVNWSGQVLHAKTTTQISNSCLQSVKHAQTLDLSFNNLQCDETSCEFQEVVMQMRNLSFLNLKNNSIKQITASLVTMTKHFPQLGESEMVDMMGNPVEKFHLNPQPISVIESWFRIMKTSDLVSLKSGTLWSIDFKGRTFIDLELWRLTNLESVQVRRATNLHWPKNNFATNNGPALFPTGLVTLELGYFALTLDGAKSLAMELPSSQIKELILFELGINDESAKILASMLPKSSIKKLYMECNEIGDEGAKALAAVLLRSRVVLLDVEKNSQMGKEGLQALQEVNGKKNILNETVEVRVQM
jgi:hypothetical protein